MARLRIGDKVQIKMNLVNPLGNPWQNRKGRIIATINTKGCPLLYTIKLCRRVFTSGKYVTKGNFHRESLIKLEDQQ